MTSYLVEGLNFGAALGVGKFCNCAWNTGSVLSVSGSEFNFTR